MSRKMIIATCGRENHSPRRLITMASDNLASGAKATAVTLRRSVANTETAQMPAAMFMNCLDESSTRGWKVMNEPSRKVTPAKSDTPPKSDMAMDRLFMLLDDALGVGRTSETQMAFFLAAFSRESQSRTIRSAFPASPAAR